MSFKSPKTQILSFSMIRMVVEGERTEVFQDSIGFLKSKSKIAVLICSTPKVKLEISKSARLRGLEKDITQVKGLQRQILRRVQTQIIEYLKNLFLLPKKNSQSSLSIQLSNLTAKMDHVLMKICIKRMVKLCCSNSLAMMRSIIQTLTQSVVRLWQILFEVRTIHT